MSKHGADRAATGDPDPGRTALDWARESGVADQVVRGLEARLRRRRRARAAIAGAGAALIFAAALVYPSRRNRSVSASAPPAPTAWVIAPETRVLADGSRVELKAGAQIVVDYSAAYRRVELVRGEALFRVAKNPARPFIVTAARVQVRAVGTVFAVAVAREDVEVLVTEGKVAVNRPDPAAAPAAPTFLIAGDCAVVPLSAAAANPSVRGLSAASMSDELSWRIPRLQFSGTQLSDAIPLLNRYSGVRLILAQPSLGGLKLSGVLRADDVDTMLTLLQGEFGLVAVRRGDEIRLSRR